MARVLLIGGAGLVGCHLTLQLASHDHDIWIYDNLHASRNVSATRAYTHQLLLKRAKAVCTWYQASVTDIPQLERAFREARPQVVYYLAALLASESAMHPEQALTTQVEGLRNALQLAGKYSEVQRFVFASSSYVYGDFEAPIIDERHPRRPIDVYGRTKLIGEELVQIYHHLFHLEYSIIRPAAIYGVGDARPRFVSQAIDCAIQGRPVVVYDPDFVSDFTYVNDAIQGFELVGFMPEGANQTFNLTYGEAHTNRDLQAELATCFPQASITLVDQAEEEGIILPKRGALNTTKARTLLGYQSAFDLADGIRHYIDSYHALEQGHSLPSG